MFARPPSRALLRAAAAAAAAAAPFVAYAQASPTPAASSASGREPPALGEYPRVVPAHPLHHPVPDAPLPSKFVCGASQYPANDPIEDRYAFLELDKGKVVLAAVMDGHGGWQASEYARRSLLETVAAELGLGGEQGSPSPPSPSPPAPGAMAEALSRAFVSVDRSFLSLVLPAYNVGFGDLSSVGCCALAAAVLPDAVVVANAGDCRAVLGRTAAKPPPGAKADGKPGEWRVTRVGATGPGRGASIPSPASSMSTAAPTPFPSSPSSSSPPIYYSALPLSRDHNAREEYEKARLAAEHPGEPDIVVCKPNTSPEACYVKGRLQPTRALGDGYLKDRRFNPPAGSEKGWGRQVRGTFTPPYVSSTPEVTVEPLNPSSPADSSAFLILACDGVWDVMTSDEAVSFVAEQVAAAGGPAKASAAQLEAVARRLRDHALVRAAEQEGMSLEQLRQLRPGKSGANSRRNFHDDLTTLVLFVGSGYAAKPAGAAGASGGGGWKLW